MTLLAFRVGDRWFSIDRAALRGVVERPALSPAPGAPAWLRGAYNDLGRAVAAVDVAEVVGLGRAGSPTAWLVIAETTRGPIGFCTDSAVTERTTEGLPRRGRVVEIVDRRDDLLYVDLALLPAAIEAALAAGATA